MVSVSASFVWRCLSGSTVAPFPHLNSGRPHLFSDDHLATAPQCYCRKALTTQAKAMPRMRTPIGGAIAITAPALISSMRSLSTDRHACSACSRACSASNDGPKYVSDCRASAGGGGGGTGSVHSCADCQDPANRQDNPNAPDQRSSRRCPLSNATLCRRFNDLVHAVMARQR
jgi:hypothetical protein